MRECIKVCSLDSENTLVKGSEKIVWEDPKEKGRFPIPEGYIKIDSVPEYSRYQIPRLIKGKKWEVIPDYRGAEFYDNANGHKAEYKIEQAGIEPDFKRYSLDKPDEALGAYIRRSGNAWIVDTERKEQDEKQRQIAELENQLKELDLKRVRPMAEITQEINLDRNKEYLAQYNSEAQNLRAQLIELKDGV